MPTDIRCAIDQALSKVNSELPDITPDIVDQIKSLQERMLRVKNGSLQPLADGVHEGSFNSEYLRTLRDSLAIYRNTVIPALMKQELNKLRNVAALAETMSAPIPNEQLARDSVSASRSPEKAPLGQGPAGEGENAS
jgi:hypothetical protein